MKHRSFETVTFLLGIAVGLTLGVMLVSSSSRVGLVARLDGSKVAELGVKNEHVSYSETYYKGRLHNVSLNISNGDESRRIDGKAALKMLEAK